MQPCGTYNISYKQDMAVVRTHLQWGLLIAGLILLFCLPLFIGERWLSFLNMTAMAIICVLGLQILTGYTGQISLGQAAFMGVGAYTSAILTTTLGLSFWIALPCAGIASGLIGLVFGLPALKVKGFYLALTTLAAQFIITWAIIHTPGLTGGTPGMHVASATLGGITIFGDKPCYFLIMAITVLLTIFAKNLVRTGVGRAFIAIRDNDLAAEVMGINVYGYKLLAFFIASFYAGIAGSLWANYITFLVPEYFALTDSIWYLGMLIVGGMGSITGAFFGTIFLKLLSEFVGFISPILATTFPAIGGTVSAFLGLILFGMVIILFLIFEPRGLHHWWESFKASYRLHPFAY